MVFASKLFYCNCFELILCEISLVFIIFGLKAILMELFCGLYALIYLYYLMNIMVFNVTFNNISVISWRSVLLIGENGVPGENHCPGASH
jgi:hypothetical protein